MSSRELEPSSQPPCAGKVELRRGRSVQGDGEEEESGSRAAFCSPDSVSTRTDLHAPYSQGELRAAAGLHARRPQSKQGSRRIVRGRRGAGECGGRWGGREKGKTMTCGAHSLVVGMEFET
jgi:hypothetical protein